jgi:signal transduction histidine kinase
MLYDLIAQARVCKWSDRRELAATLNDMLARLEESGARQWSLVSDAAPELRSLLGSIRLQLESRSARRRSRTGERAPR